MVRIRDMSEYTTSRGHGELIAGSDDCDVLTISHHSTRFDILCRGSGELHNESVEDSRHPCTTPIIITMVSYPNFHVKIKARYVSCAPDHAGSLVPKSSANLLQMYLFEITESPQTMTPYVTISGMPVNPISYGMRSLMHPGRVSTPDAIATLRAALDAGSNFWNASGYYGTPEHNSLHLLNAYFRQYPEDCDKFVISVKSCIEARDRTPLCDAPDLRSCIDRCLAILDGECKIAVLSPARLDLNSPVSLTERAIQEYVTAGKSGGIGLSGCSGASIREAMQIAPIQAVEVELSLFETGISANGVADACAEYGIPIITYSPIGRGFLTDCGCGGSSGREAEGLCSDTGGSGMCLCLGREFRCPGDSDTRDGVEGVGQGKCNSGDAQWAGAERAQRRLLRDPGSRHSIPEETCSFAEHIELLLTEGQLHYVSAKVKGTTESMSSDFSASYSRYAHGAKDACYADTLSSQR
nr:pyridoxal reductase [Quercus suber]